MLAWRASRQESKADARTATSQALPVPDDGPGIRGRMARFGQNRCHPPAQLGRYLLAGGAAPLRLIGW
jgi:hypothetical protein